MCARIARHRGAGPVIAVDSVRERLEMAQRHGIEVIDSGATDDVVGALQELTAGRGPDSVIDAVGMEAHGSPFAEFVQKAASKLPSRAAAALAQRAGIDRLAALYQAIRAVRRGGTVSIIGVYGGQADPMPMLELFDKGVTLRMGQAHVKRWVDDILPLLLDGDPLGTDDLATHRLPLDDAPHAYRIFQEKRDGAVKILLQP
jgi:threonine dehydrogenase-like Zn-dependent dehydrogenase